MAKKLPPLHPGEVLREEFLVPMGMSAGALAKACGVPRTRIERLANEQIGVTCRYGFAAIQGIRYDARTMAQPAEQLSGPQGSPRNRECDRGRASAP